MIVFFFKIILDSNIKKKDFFAKCINYKKQIFFYKFDQWQEIALFL